ncbi:MAG: hypothetical protein ABW182_01575 [Sphingomonas sp.]
MQKFRSISVFAFALTMVPAGAALAQDAAPAPAQAAPAPAQVAAAPAAGATVYDNQGLEIGKIESVADGNAVVFTGTNRASIPLSKFGASPKGPTLALTKAELDAAAAQAAAAGAEQLRAQLKPGTQVHGSAGAVLATVKALDGDNVVLTAGSREVRVPINGFGINAQGVFINMSQAQFDAAVASSAPAGR